MRKTISVSAMEYSALCDVANMVKIAMMTPNAGEMLAGALQALDMVRKDEGIEHKEEAPKMHQPPKLVCASVLTQALIDRIK